MYDEEIIESIDAILAQHHNNVNSLIKETASKIEELNFENSLTVANYIEEVLMSDNIVCRSHARIETRESYVRSQL